MNLYLNLPLGHSLKVFSIDKCCLIIFEYSNLHDWQPRNLENDLKDAYDSLMVSNLLIVILSRQ